MNMIGGCGMPVIFHSLTVLAVCLTVGVVLFDRLAMEKACLLTVRDITVLFFLMDRLSLLLGRNSIVQTGVQKLKSKVTMRT